MTARRRGPKVKNAPEGYARYSVAKKLFEPFKEGVFNYRVKMGDILVKVEENGEKLYNVASILQTKTALAEEEKAKQIALTKHMIRWTTVDDVAASMILDQDIYHETQLANIAHYQERKQKNPYTSCAVFDMEKKNTMYAYISLLPLPEETIMDILLGKRNETEITSKDILSYDQLGEYSLLVSSVAQHPDYKNLLGGLIRFHMDFWVDLYPKRRIKRIYAQTVSDDGRKLANKLHMGPIYTVIDGKPQRVKDAYVVDLDELAASKIIREFQQRLKDKDQTLNHPSA
jgi:hypothetical protein